MKQNRRHQYLVNKPLQTKMIVYICLLLLGVLLVAHGLAMGFAELISSRHAGTMLAGTSWQFDFKSVLEGLWLPILIALILGVIFVLIFGLLYSHRIAGPLFNLKRMLKTVENGDLNITMHIRQHDELHDMEYAFNQMVESLNTRLKIIKALGAQMSAQDKTLLEKALQENFNLK